MMVKWRRLLPILVALVIGWVAGLAKPAPRGGRLEEAIEYLRVAKQHGYRRETIVAWLKQHGCEPTLIASGRESILRWINKELSVRPSMTGLEFKSWRGSEELWSATIIPDGQWPFSSEGVGVELGFEGNGSLQYANITLLDPGAF